MDIKETVIKQQVEEKLKRLNQLAQLLESEKGLSLKKINKFLAATAELQEELIVYKYIKSLPQEELVKSTGFVQPETDNEEILEKVVAEEEVEEIDSSQEEQIETKEELIESNPLEEEIVVEQEDESLQDSLEEDLQESNEVKEEIQETVEEKKVEIEVPTQKIEELSEHIERDFSALGMGEGGMEVNEIAALEKDNSLNTRLQRQPVEDLRKAIGLNERFLYANELFNGNMEAFNLAVNELNNITTQEDAFRIIDLQLKPKFNWAEDSEAVLQFIDLVERRFL